MPPHVLALPPSLRGLEALQQARSQEVQFSLAAPGEGVRRVLELARLDKVFAIHDTLEEGLGGGA